jgi:hypothetical protein
LACAPIIAIILTSHTFTGQFAFPEKIVTATVVFKVPIEYKALSDERTPGVAAILKVIGASALHRCRD